MKHILMIIANKGFQDLEFWNPYHLFLDKWYHIDIASGKGGECFWVFWTHIEHSLSFEEVEVKKYDALVFVWGGGTYEEYNNDPQYLALAKQAENILAAICIAPSILSKSWLFKGKEITGRDDGEGTEISIMKQNGAIFIPQDVVRDNNIITACWPEASVAFGHTIIEALEENL